MMVNIKNILVVVFCLVIFSISGQNKIEGSVRDDKDEPIPFCALGLLNAADSTVKKGNITNEKGEFVFENIPTGKYIIKSTSAGYDDGYFFVIQIDSTSVLKLDPLIMQNKGVHLNEVSVTAIKKMIEFKNGNITVNVENSPLAAGNSVYDLLMRLPGVLVDGENIMLNGKNGVRFLIDDRLQQLSGQQLISLLKSINASSVEKIEIIKNPPVKYDASGTGGLINIVTKKVKITGFSGNAMVSSSQGFYSNNFSQLSLNYKANKFSLFSNFNANYSEYRGVNDWHREVSNGTSVTNLDQHYVEKNTNQFASYFLGADWYVNKRNTISVRIDGRPGKELVQRNATTAISDNSLGYNNLAFRFEKPNSWFLQDYNINLEHLFDSVGTKLNVYASYSYYPDLYQGFYQNHYLDSNFVDDQPMKIFKSKNYVNISVSTAKADFEKKLSKSLALEAGAKASYQTLLSDFAFENLDNQTGVYYPDTNFTNIFEYKEQILASYVNLKAEVKKFNFQAGLRAENTTVNAESKSNSVKYNRDYFNLFPVASIDYNRSDKHQFSLSYNRRINRADYNSFNPYKSFRSILTATQGNPYLLPQYTHNFQFVYTFKGNISNTFSYARTNNYFLGYNLQNNVTKEIIFYMSNLKNSQTFTYSFFMQKDIAKWWHLAFDFNSYYFFYSGNIDNVYYSASAFCNQAGLYSQFSLSKSTKLELNGWIAGPWLDGVNHNKTRGSFNFGFKKNLLDDKLNISIGVYDVFYTQRSKNYIRYADQNSSAVHYWDSRRVYINLNYNFGKIKVQQKRVKSDSEEKNRFKRS